jgi:predicted RNA-binding protein YlxR (DUF448 family)
MSQPIRMCIACRERALQSDLQRLQIIDGKLVEFTKVGRSFYVCAVCVASADKKLLKVVNHKCKTNYKSIHEFGKIFKEIGSNG